RTVARVKTWSPYAGGRFNRANNDFAHRVNVSNITRAWSPQSLIIKDASLEARVTVFIWGARMRWIVPVEFGAVNHFIIVDKLLDWSIATPVVIAIRTIGKTRQSAIFPAPV